MLGQLRKRLFGISLTETTVERRGFAVSDDNVRANLEKIGQMFVAGYHAALLDDNPQSLADHLNKTIAIEYQGFAFEGAGMGLTLLDLLPLGRNNRLRTFVDGPGNNHYYMIHVGAGWALARLKRRVDKYLKRCDPVVGWLVVEGYGFHETYFDWPRVLEKQERPKHLQGYAGRVFDQGLGRCLWFVKGSDPDRIAHTIATFPDSRQADIWSGVGLACGYAGGVDADAIQRLATLADVYQTPMAQGAAFAAGARHRAGNPVAHTELACQILWRSSLAETAHLVEAAGIEIPLNGPEPTWETWRQRVQAQAQPVPTEGII